MNDIYVGFFIIVVVIEKCILIVVFLVFLFKEEKLYIEFGLLLLNF